jgi:hypothetical protein
MSDANSLAGLRGSDCRGPSARVLLAATVIILFWVGMWGFIEEVLGVVRKSIGVSPLQLYAGLIVVAVALAIRYPLVLERF